MEGVGREEDRPTYRQFEVAVTTWGSYKAPTTYVEEMFMEQWQRFQVMTPQLVPTILSTMTSQGKMPSRKADQLTMDNRHTVS